MVFLIFLSLIIYLYIVSNSVTTSFKKKELNTNTITSIHEDIKKITATCGTLTTLYIHKPKVWKSHTVTVLSLP